MDGFSRCSLPFERKQNSRQWGSETDLENSSLPPIQGNDKRSSNFRWIPNNSGKQFYANRTPTPSPGVNTDSVFSFGKTSRLTTSSSSQRLSLNLDLQQIVKGTDFRRHSTGFTDHSPEAEWSPGICVRSLPPSPTSSPTAQRSRRVHHRHLRRLPSDGEQGNEKDDRILNWIRDVSEKTQAHSYSFDDDGEEIMFNCSFDKNEDTSFNGVNGLPVIQEGRKT